jgi:hypothetical protein
MLRWTTHRNTRGRQEARAGDTARRRFVRRSDGLLVEALTPGDRARVAFQVALDGGCLLALAFLGRLLIELAPAKLGQYTGFFARALETPQGSVEVLTFSYTDAWHEVLFRKK